MTPSAFALLLLAAAPLSARAAGPQRHPNLVYIFPDQMRGQAMGFLGEEPVITPNLNRLAEQALVLPQAVSNYPVCSPYRAMLMSGRYPHANGVLANCNSQGTIYGYELREKERCWSDILAEQGYSLGYIGKWHLDAPHKPYVKSYNNSPKFAWNEWCPPRRRHGFDFWYAYGTFDRHMTPEYWSSHMRRDERIKVHQWGPEHEADLAIEYIRNSAGKYRAADKPFALVVAMNPPHTGYRAHPPRYLEPYRAVPDEALCTRPDIPPANEKMGKYYRNNIRHYYAMITGVDEQVGRIVQAIDEAGLGEDTIVVFTSDHGNCLGIHGCISKNVHYEESMRVPFLIRWPGKIPPRRDDLLLSSPDIYPTLLDLMGFAARIPPQVQGASRAAIFRGGEGPRPTSQLYLWIPYGQPAGGRRGVRTRRYTLMLERLPGKPMRTVLHDNRVDPYQLENLAEQSPEIVEQLIRIELEPWLKRTADPWLGADGEEGTGRGHKGNPPREDQPGGPRAWR